MADKTPIYLITGFLGAGKTTLFQRVARFSPFDHALIIVNEFGATSIDDMLMVNQNGQAKPLAGGCVCCSSRNELLTTIQIALGQDCPPSAIVIETTGLASPQPILNTLAGNHNLSMQLDVRIITVMDAMTAIGLVEKDQTAQEQLVLADGVVLTKTDLMADESQMATLDPYLHQLNPLAEIVHSADQTDDALAHWLSQQMHQETGVRCEVSGDHIGTIQSIIFNLAEPVSVQMLEAFLFEASRRLGSSLLRLKGFVQLEGQLDARWLVQMVQGVISPPEVVHHNLPDDPMRIVAIADGIVLTELRLIFDGIFGKGAIDTSDAQAINDNPLSVAGL